MSKTFNWNAVVRSAIRRAFARSPKVRDVMNAGKRKVSHLNKDGSRAKVDRVEFNCQVCHSWVPAKLMSGVDHIIPVVSVEEGFRDWNTYISRIDCDPKNLQRICKKCHDFKSLIERRTRQVLKDKVELDTIEERINIVGPMGKETYLKKQLSKFKSKTKAEETRARAIKLLEELK
jgi:5-methylcytosine-specific restriction endonuclease McrA